MKLLCYDIGGTDIKYGVVEDGMILYKDKFPTKAWRKKEEIEEDIIKYGQVLIDQYPDIKGVSVSTCGSVNIDTGELLTGQEASPGLWGFNFKKLFKDHFGLDSVADNDVNSFSSAERFYGAGKDYQTYFVITLGTGIGGAVIVNNKIWRGKSFNAGEVGRMPLLPDDTSWENLASVKALVDACTTSGLKVENGADIFNLYDAHDEKITPIVNTWFDNVGRGLASIIYLFNPEVIVIGGGISNRKTLFDELTYYCNKHLVEGFKDTYQIIPAKFLNDGGLIGAYCNFLEYYNLK